MALDIGLARVGIAVSDSDMRVATPVCVLSYDEVVNGARTFRNVIEDWDPSLLLCGLPYTMTGKEGPQAESIREAAERIGQICNLPIEYTDERLSSQEAKQILRKQGLNEKQMRGKVDMIAASLFLETWLAKRRDAITSE